MSSGFFVLIQKVTQKNITLFCFPNQLCKLYSSDRTKIRVINIIIVQCFRYICVCYARTSISNTLKKKLYQKKIKFSFDPSQLIFVRGIHRKK